MFQIITKFKYLLVESTKEPPVFFKFSVKDVIDIKSGEKSLTKNSAIESLNAWAKRQDIKRKMLENKIYVVPGEASGQYTFRFTYLLEAILDKYRNKIQQNYFSVMSVLRGAFYLENQNRWLHFLAGTELYDELKCVVLYAIIAELLDSVKLEKMTVPELVHTVISAFGLETHNILGKALTGLISMDEILAIKTKISDNLINIGSTSNFKDYPFNDTYVASWEWATHEMIGSQEDRYMIMDPGIRTKSNKFARPLSKEILQMIKATKQGAQDAQEFLVESAILDSQRKKVEAIALPSKKKPKETLSPATLQAIAQVTQSAIKLLELTQYNKWQPRSRARQTTNSLPETSQNQQPTNILPETSQNQQPTNTLPEDQPVVKPKTRARASKLTNILPEDQPVVKPKTRARASKLTNILPEDQPVVKPKTRARSSKLTNILPEDQPVVKPKTRARSSKLTNILPEDQPVVKPKTRARSSKLTNILPEDQPVVKPKTRARSSKLTNILPEDQPVVKPKTRARASKLTDSLPEDKPAVK